MATIEYPSIIHRFKGKLSGSVFSSRKGTSVLKKHNSKIHQPRSEKQQQIRGFFSDLAGEYHSLSDFQKSLWSTYASTIPKEIDSMTGLNAYVKHNIIIQKYFPGSSRLTYPPSTPGTPGHVIDLYSWTLPNSSFCFSWTRPNLSTVYVIVDYWAMPGRDSVPDSLWTFGASVGSDALSCVINTEYPPNTVMKFTVRTLDIYGRVSPWSHVTSRICQPA